MKHRIIRLIYVKFVNTKMGIAEIAVYIDQNGYRKKIRQNNIMETFFLLLSEEYWIIQSILVNMLLADVRMELYTHLLAEIL